MLFFAYVNDAARGGLALTPIDDRQFKTRPPTGGGITRTAVFGERYISTGGTVTIPNYRVPRTRVLWRVTSLVSDTLRPPPVAQCVLGAEFEISLTSITGGYQGIIRPQTGEELNGIVDNVEYVATPGDTVLLRKVLTGAGTYGWMSLTNGLHLSRRTQDVTSDPNLTTGQFSNGWRGLMCWRCSYAAAGQFRLPTTPMEGTHARIYQDTDSDDVTIDAGSNPIVSAGAAASTLLLLADAPVDLVFSNGVWIGAA